MSRWLSGQKVEAQGPHDFLPSLSFLPVPVVVRAAQVRTLDKTPGPSGARVGHTDCGLIEDTPFPQLLISNIPLPTLHNFVFQTLR